jgi:hypothetical protein
MVGFETKSHRFTQPWGVSESILTTLRQACKHKIILVDVHVVFCFCLCSYPSLSFLSSQPCSLRLTCYILLYFSLSSYSTNLLLLWMLLIVCICLLFSSTCISLDGEIQALKGELIGSIKVRRKDDEAKKKISSHATRNLAQTRATVTKTYFQRFNCFK